MQFQEGILLEALNLVGPTGRGCWEEDETETEVDAAAAALRAVRLMRRMWLRTATHSSRASSMPKFALMTASFSQVHLLPWFAAF